MISNVSWGVQKIDKLDFRNNKRKIKLLKVYIYIFLAKKQKKIQRVCCYEEDTLYSLKVEVDVGANSNIIPISSSIKIKTLGKIFSFLTWLLLHGARATFFSSLPYDRKRKAVSGPKNRADSQGRMVPYFLWKYKSMRLNSIYDASQIRWILLGHILSIEMMRGKLDWPALLSSRYKQSSFLQALIPIPCKGATALYTIKRNSEVLQLGRWVTQQNGRSDC